MNVTLITGSNLNDPVKNLQKAYKEIEKRIGNITKSSSVHISEPWGFSSGDKFYNQVIICETELLPEELLKEIWAIETNLGKPRGSEESELLKKEKIEKGEIPYESRVIDIDILFYGNEIIRTKLLTIPHKQIEARSFVLKLLNEINGDYIHPVLKKSIQTLLKELEGN